MSKRSSAEQRVTLNRHLVIEAGIRLADAEGADALSMRRLGRELGVEAMALYNHVDNKDDLLDGMIERAAEEIELPEDGADWREFARRRAVSAHDVLMRHPWLPALWTARITLGPARMRYMDRALRNLRESGFPPDLLDSGYHAVENHIVGHAMQAIGFPLDAEEMRELGEPLLRSSPLAEYPDLVAHIRHHLEHPSRGDAFEFGLDLILDGLERLRDGS
ncbi:TetR/AcrR family transcriptional regulator [Nocardiopsis lucentensis]|uniref:TetR/AcrR family transcriptional regulator n=1 Tax=Nocardiopsis lucentensis TaxID=53441 RepID=UPI000345A850|nr:TetR/AcrR family transcriptional regulator [Nocardiopsis lucentensis]